MRVLFICTGNICRSPAAHAVLEARLRAEAAEGAAWAGRVSVDSAGLGGWHAGEAPDRRASAEGRRRGYRVDHPARAIHAMDLRTADLVLAMDRGHLAKLERMLPPGFDRRRLQLLRSFDPAAPEAAEVEDPYYGGDEGFAEMFDVIEASMPGLTATIRELVQA